MYIWWDLKGVLYYELYPPSKTVNSSIYCSQLEELKSIIYNKKSVWIRSRNCWSLAGTCYPVRLFHLTYPFMIFTYSGLCKSLLMGKLYFTRGPEKIHRVHRSKTWEILWGWKTRKMATGSVMKWFILIFIEFTTKKHHGLIFRPGLVTTFHPIGRT